MKKKLKKIVNKLYIIIKFLYIFIIIIYLANNQQGNLFQNSSSQKTFMKNQTFFATQESMLKTCVSFTKRKSSQDSFILDSNKKKSPNFIQTQKNNEEKSITLKARTDKNGCVTIKNIIKIAS